MHYVLDMSQASWDKHLVLTFGPIPYAISWHRSKHILYQLAVLQEVSIAQL